MSSIIENFCSILQAHPMLLIYFNDHITENHASPAAYLFFLKVFTFLQYPMLTYHYFHPFHPAVCVTKSNLVFFLWLLIKFHLEFSESSILSISHNLSRRSTSSNFIIRTIRLEYIFAHYWATFARWRRTYQWIRRTRQRTTKLVFAENFLWNCFNFDFFFSKKTSCNRQIHLKGQKKYVG